MKIRIVILILILVLATIRCSKQPPAATNPSATTLVICVGGLGENQTLDIYNAILGECKGVDVQSAAGWDGYKADLDKIISEHKKSRLVLIGHSFGGQAVIDECKKLDSVDGLILIDPVAYNWGNLALPQNVLFYHWFSRSEEVGPARANVFNGTKDVILNTDHNSLCHNPQVINYIVDKINEIASR